MGFLLVKCQSETQEIHRDPGRVSAGAEPASAVVPFENQPRF